jgi:NADPH-dependent curcumin reductase CurA
VEYAIETLGADAAFNYRTDGLTAGLARVAPHGIDVYLDNVGGNHLQAALEVMRPRGLIALWGSISTYNTPQSEVPGIANLFTAIEQGITLRGFLARDFQDRMPESRR